jgi:hypothetical protein
MGSGRTIWQRLVVGFFRLINPLMTRCLASRFHGLFSRWFVLLSFTGRKSGKQIVTPASYFERDGTLVLTTKRPWWRNLEAGRADLRLKGRALSAVTEVVRDEREVAERLLAAPRWFRVLTSLDEGRPGGMDRAALRDSAREGRVVVHVRPLVHQGNGSGTAESSPES